MTPFRASEAAALLVERRLSGAQGERLPEDCRPYTLVDALSIQAAVSRHWCEQLDDSIGGWKCLLPPTDRIIVGPIYTRTIDSVSPVALWPEKGVARIEPELAFILGQDLPARAQPYSQAEVDAAIARTHMALELIHCRYREPSHCQFPEMLADGLVNQGLFIGPQVDSATAAAAASINIRLKEANAEPRLFDGKHPNSNPRAPIYWLVEFLRSQGQGLLAGQALITGSYAGVIEVPLNTAINIQYQGLGEMQVSFNARQGF